MKRKTLYLDDTRIPDPSLDFDIVRSYDEFTDYILRNGMPDVISFDHDLADEHVKDYLRVVNKEKKDLDYSSYTEKTGFEAMKWAVRYCMMNHVTFPDTYCHSMNVPGSERIMQYMNNVYKLKKLDKKCTKVFWKHKTQKRDEVKAADK